MSRNIFKELCDKCKLFSIDDIQVDKLSKETIMERIDDLDALEKYAYLYKCEYQRAHLRKIENEYKKTPQK